MKYIALISILFACQIGLAQNKLISSQIRSVDIYIHDSKKADNIENSHFVLDAYINGVSQNTFAGRFTVSPGALTNNPKEGKEPELTPEGSYNPIRLEEDYVSKQFGGKILGIFETGAMPHTIFFYNGFAIHGSSATVDGKPASKGCVRLHKPNAKKLFSWVNAAINNTGTNRSVKIHVLHTESKAMRAYRRK